MTNGGARRNSEWAPSLPVRHAKPLIKVSMIPWLPPWWELAGQMWEVSGMTLWLMTYRLSLVG
jgi:hypothetical protein